MSRTLIAAYGAASYFLFLGTFLYLIGFIAGIGVPKGVDDGPLVAWPLALAVNLGLIALFGVQHSVMARPGFKRLWTRVVPPAAERSTYVLLSSVALIVLYLAWLPMPAQVWSVEAPWLRGLLWTLFGLGWVVALVSTFLIDHFDLFGLRQVWHHWRGTECPSHPFFTPAFYRWVRHPLMTGFLMVLWLVPDMTVGHLVFSAGMTAYIVVGTLYEERDLIAAFGDRYRRYAASVPRFIPMPGRRAGE
ncbi:MAG: isoprenylcysteine carboxylmethyltransferase family protein [Salinisphaeraceae bacterium]